MKKANIIWMLLLTILILSGCNSTKALLTDKIEAKDIDKIQVRLAMGNPKYGAESKIIIDKDEIKRFVDTFNSATISDKVESDNIAISGSSTYYFYSKDALVKRFSFNGNDSERIWYNSSWYHISYPDKKPYELYKSSSAQIIIVDENLNELKDTVKRVSPE